MPDRRAHMLLGAAAGVGTAAFAARHQEGMDLFLEAVGGALGGLAGGVVPDLVEPAVDSWHRRLAHSYAAATVTSVGVHAGMSRLQVDFRARAERHRQFVRASVSFWDRLWHGIAASFWQLAAGVVAGLAGGYLSHLALDAWTPRGLPFLGVGRQ
jgi:hypothetical protein